jgi:hypothetical protein
MFKKIFVVAAVASIASVIGLAKPAGADEPADWSLENCVDASGHPTTKLADGAQCDLKNRKSGKCLVHDSHRGQVDWDFATCSAHPRSVKVTAKAGGAISCGETVAIKIGSEYFRKCHDPQIMGINICSEGGAPQAMHYEWQFQGCSGQLETGKPVALYNTSKKDSVVYAKRPSKMVDTCWADNMKYGQCTTFRDK